MRTPRRSVDRYRLDRLTTVSVTDVVLTYLASIGTEVTPWQAVVIREAYAEREPYRTIAIVE